MELFKKDITLQQAKRGRLISRLFFAIIAFVVPVILTCVKFKLFSSEVVKVYKISFVCILVLLIIFWRFKKRIGEWITKWEDNNIFKWILLGISKVWVFILLVVVLYLCTTEASKLINDIIFCLEWTCVCELVSYVVIYPVEMKYDYLVKRMIRKQERKEDYKEAIKELKEEEDD